MASDQDTNLLVRLLSTKYPRKILLLLDEIQHADRVRATREPETTKSSSA